MPWFVWWIWLPAAAITGCVYMVWYYIKTMPEDTVTPLQNHPPDRKGWGGQASSQPERP